MSCLTLLRMSFRLMVLQIYLVWNHFCSRSNSKIHLIKIECCFLPASEAKLEGAKKKWKKYLYWKGAKINRFSSKYYDFILSAYRQLYQNTDFKTALISTGNKLLLHTIGRTFRKNTVLTWWEFTYILSKLRRESRL